MSDSIPAKWLDQGDGAKRFQRRKKRNTQADAANDCLAETETNTVIGACVMFLAILIAWNLPILRDFISGLKVNYLLFSSQL